MKNRGKILITALFISILLIGCENTKQGYLQEETKETETINNETSKETEYYDEMKMVHSKYTPIDASYFSVKEYSYKNIIDQTYRIVVITNNGNKEAYIWGIATAYDSAGNEIDTAHMSIDVLEVGKTSIGEFCFYDTSGIDRVECQIEYYENKYSDPMNGELSVEQCMNEENLSAIYTNHSKSREMSFTSYALFFDADDNVVDFSRWSASLNPGETRAIQHDCYDGYDHAELFFNGCAYKMLSDEENAKEMEPSENMFDITEHLCEGRYDTWYLLIINNNATDAYKIKGVARAKDASGNILGVSNMTIKVVGADETSLGSFFFRNVTGIDKVEYSLTVEEAKNCSIIDDLKVKEEIGRDYICVKVTNESLEKFQFVKAHILFYDKNNNVVHYSYDSIGNDKLEVKPWRTYQKQFRTPSEYDHYEVYVTGEGERKDSD